MQIYAQAARHLAAVLPDKPAEAVGPLDAQRVAVYLTAHLASPASVNLYLRAIKAVWNWAQQSEILPKNVFKSVKFIRDKRPGRDVYRTPELDRLLAACPDDRWRLIVALAATTGMRRGEICALQWGDIRED
jgi:integrase